jgi:hypothetical protein
MVLQKLSDPPLPAPLISTPPTVKPTDFKDRILTATRAATSSKSNAASPISSPFHRMVKAVAASVPSTLAYAANLDHAFSKFRTMYGSDAADPATINRTLWKAIHPTLAGHPGT